MSLVQKLFGFQGRLRRRDWWLLGILLVVAQWVVSSLAIGISGGAMGGWAGGMGGGWGAGMGSGWGASMMARGVAPFGGVMRQMLLVQVAVSALFLWPSVALSVKRLHDRNHTGWWLLLPYALAAARGFLMFQAFSQVGGGYGMMSGWWTGRWGMAGGHWSGMQAHAFQPPTGLGAAHIAVSLALLVVAIWLLVELGILDGTKGPNRFGPSPKGVGATG